MTTAADNDGPCYKCGTSREACDARRDSWPRNCCPACLHTPAWGAHARRSPTHPAKPRTHVNGSA
jgi:hypothetical protein